MCHGVGIILQDADIEITEKIGSPVGNRQVDAAVAVEVCRHDGDRAVEAGVIRRRAEDAVSLV